MDNLREFLKGKKTYLLAAAAILGTVVAWADGSVATVDAVKFTLESLGACTIRAGISKAVEASRLP